MTTIAYKDGVIAYDSRRTQGSRIADDDCEKLMVVNGVSFVLTGAVSDFQTLIECYFGSPKTGVVDAGGMVIDGDRIWVVGHCEESGFWKEPQDKSVPFATGSGAAHAITAIDMGANAAEAVEMAKRRDTGTGGAVRTINVGVQP